MQAMCRVCEEVILNPICIDCMSNGVMHWFKDNGVDLKREFIEFNSLLKRVIAGEEKTRCVSCMKESNSLICPYCYSKQVYHWLKHKDKELAVEFKRVFNFDFERTGYDNERYLL